MPSPLLSLLAYLGNATQGYQEGVQQRDQRDADASYLAALQALSNPQTQGNGAPPQGAGQPSVPASPPLQTTPVPGSVPINSIQIPQVNASALQPPQQRIPRTIMPPSSQDPVPSPPPQGALPTTTPLPTMQPPQSPQAAMPQAPAQGQGQYAQLIQRVVQAVNQAMPNADPNTKSMVARELMETAVKGEASDQARQSALDLKNQQLLERERNDQTIAGIRQQLADVAAQRATTSATQGQERLGQGQERIDIARTSGTKSVLSDEDYQKYKDLPEVKMAADSMHGGVPISQVMPGLSANNPTRAAAERLFAEKYPNDDYAADIATQAGNKAYQTAGARRESTTAQGVGEFDKLLEPTRKSLARLNLGQFPDLNALRNSVAFKTGDPNVVEAANRIQELQNAYTAILVRGGQRSDAAQALSERTIQMMFAPGQANRALDIMEDNSKLVMQGIEGARARPNTTGAAKPSASSESIPPPPPGFVVQ